MGIPPRYKAGKILRHIEMSGSRHFMIVVYDLLSEPVDGIVNAANGGLSHGGGIAAQIAVAAGDDLEKEGSQFVKRNGYIATGDAVLTTAGRLPYKGIIHAVGPRVGEGNELELLISAVFNSLQLAHEQDWSSISFPAISSGIFSVPLEICSRGYILGIVKFLKAFPESPLKVIRLCLNLGPVVEAVLAEIDKRAQFFEQL